MPLDDLVREALAIEAESARQAGTLGYMARSLVQASFPHKKPDGIEFTRTNGTFTLSMWAPSKVGLPYGSIPRMLMAWLTTEAVRTKDRSLLLGDTLSAFMRQLDMVPTGGRWGTITRLRDQSRRLFTTSVSCIYEDEHRQAEVGFRVVDKHVLWWEPKDPTQTSLFESYVVLSDAFFKEVIANPVPVDMRALKALKKSPLALDIYCWLTYRMSYLKDPIEIPWGALQLQFGSGYATHAHGLRDFRRAFLRELRKVRAVYGQAKIGDGKVGLVLKPSPPHISARKS
jgi:hypothetical protein